MVSIREQNAMAEVLHYLKGIKQEDIEKIPENIITYLNENASKEYKCSFDYNKPLKDLKLLNETRGLIGLICYKYWCVTEEQKEVYLTKLKENEGKKQEELAKKYNIDNIFKKQKQKDIENLQKDTESMAITKWKKPMIKRIIDKLKNVFMILRKNKY